MKLISACTIMFLAACQPRHVRLSAPTAAEPIETRVKAYESLSPIGYKETHTTILQNGIPISSSRHTDYLQLANGTRVYHAIDLAPVVAPGSAAATAIAASEENAGTARTLAGTGWGVFGAGATMILIWPAVGLSDTGETDWTLFGVGAGVMVVGGILALVAGPYARNASDERDTAFSVYEAGLRERLHLCVKDGKIVDCP